MVNQPVAVPLQTHRTTQIQNKCIHTPNIHAVVGIRTHDPSVRAGEDSSCIRPRSHFDRPPARIPTENSTGKSESSHLYPQITPSTDQFLYIIDPERHSELIVPLICTSQTFLESQLDTGCGSITSFFKMRAIRSVDVVAER
jgi:hypothetical protein